MKVTVENNGCRQEIEVSDKASLALTIALNRMKAELDSEDDDVHDTFGKLAEAFNMRDMSIDDWTILGTRFVNALCLGIHPVKL